VIVDRELITGQNPSSDHRIAAAVVEALNRGRVSTRMTGGALRPRSAGATPLTRSNTMSTHVKIMATLAAKPRKAEELRTLLNGMVGPSRAEPCNLRYDLWQDQADPARFVLDELYADADAVAGHRATPHFQRYLSVINDLAERTSAVLTPILVA
jgi:quinol monooxygenase YgiN